MKLGHNFTGYSKGVKTLNRSNKDNTKQWQEHFFGIGVPLSNGYANQENIFEVKLTKNQIEGGYIQALQNTAGKLVTIPYFEQVNNNNYKTIFCGAQSMDDILIHEHK